MADKVEKIDKLEKKEGDKHFLRRPDGSLRIATFNSEKSMAQKSFKDRVNVNNIMKKYTYKQLPDIPSVVADFSGLGDFHEMSNAVAKARGSFASLPSHLRNRFENDPQKLIDFVSDRKNLDEAVKLGLVEKPIEAPALIPELKP